VNNESNSKLPAVSKDGIGREISDEYLRGFNRCRDLAMHIVDEHDGFLSRIDNLDAITTRLPPAPSRIPVLTDGPAEGIDDTPWMDYEQAGKEACAEERVIVFKAKPTGQKFAAHPDGHKAVEPAAPVVRNEDEDNFTTAARFAGISFSQGCQFHLMMQHLLGNGPAPGFLPASQPAPVVVSEEEKDKHWDAYLDMAKTRDIGDIASAMMVRDAACGQYVIQKRLKHDPEDKDVVVWLESLSAQPAPLPSDDKSYDAIEKSEVVEWLNDRMQNALRIAETKEGDDRHGWNEDALFFESAIRHIALPVGQKETFEQWWSREYKENLGGLIIELAFKEVAEKSWNAAKESK
jgi:hypothetical protein